MDARAVNDERQQLLAELALLLEQIRRRAVAEGERQRQLARLMETEVQRARMAPLEERLTAKGIARRLRGPLAVLADPSGQDALAFFRAAGVVREVIAACPTEQLLAPAVRHELRGRKFDLLRQLVAGVDRPAQLEAA